MAHPSLPLVPRPCALPPAPQVRIYCFNHEFDTAGELVLESGSRSAAYHLAKQHEVGTGL